MNRYVYFAVASALCACAYGMTPEQELPRDGGILHIDSGPGKDAKAPPPDAGPTVKDSSVDLPDVQQQTACSSLPLATGEPSCDTCLGSSCCAEDQQCGSDQDCIGFVTCVDDCLPPDGGPPDSQCESDCESAYPNGANELMNLDDCMQTSCTSSCF